MSEQSAETIETPQEPRAKREISTLVASYIDMGLDRLADLGRAERYAFCARWASTIGHYAILVAAVVGFLGGIIVAIKTKDATMFWGGLGWLVLLPVLQYVAVKFLDTTQTLVERNKTEVGSAGFLRCTALLALVSAVVALIGGLAGSISGSSFSPLLGGIASGVILTAVAWMALRPELLSISVHPAAGAGEEALGVFSFFLKTFVKLVPIVFGAVLAIATAMLAITVVRAIGAEGYGVLSVSMQGMQSVTAIVWAILLPFIAYLTFVFYYLIIDVIRAILSIPRQLDALKK